MPTDISPQKYCKDPSKYKNDPAITPQTRRFYSQYCKTLKKIESEKQVDHKAIGQAQGDALLNMMEMFISPQSLAIIAAGGGFVFTYKTIRSGVVNWIKKGVSDDILQAAEEMAAEGADEGAINSAIMLDGMWGEMAIGDLDAAGGALRYTAAALFEGMDMLGSILSVVMVAAMVVQMIGMILDGWDPCHLKDQLNAATLRQVTTNFNTTFRDNVLAQVETVRNSYGTVMLSTLWPIEYYADRSILIAEKEDYYKPIRLKFYIQYINTLKYNSNGQLIDWDYDKSNNRIIQNSDLSVLETNVLKMLGNDNTVVENWIYRFWPLIILAILIIVVIILFVRNK